MYVSDYAQFNANNIKQITSKCYSKHPKNVKNTRSDLGKKKKKDKLTKMYSSI